MPRSSPQSPRGRSAFWHRRGLLFAIALLSLLFGASMAGEKRPRSEVSPLGINLTAIRPYAPELPFVDVLKTARRWRVKGGDGRLDLGPDEWPRSLQLGQEATLQFFAGLDGHFPDGVWVCLYEGSGTLDFPGAHVVDRRPGRIAVRFPRHGAILTLQATDPRDPIRNVRLVMPGFEATHLEQPFHPTFLERWRGFRVIRFMDWGETNRSEIRHWSDRTLPAQFQGTDRGVAFEYMLQLANQLDAEPWLSVPHLADDDYVRRLAMLVKEKLDPDRRVWIEYSNEVWNGMFEQAEFARSRGRELGLSDKATPAGLRYTARRSVEIFRIFEEVFGGTTRLVRVLAGQASTPGRARELIAFENAHRHADVYAIASYFGGRLARKSGPQLVALGMDAALAEVRKDLDSQAELARQNVALAREFGLPLVAYEGGQHLRGRPNDDALTTLLTGMNRTFAMGELYSQHLANWKKAGGTVFVQFASVSGYGKHGSWGALEWYDQEPTQAPKYQALLRFAAENPRWWEGAP